MGAILEVLVEASKKILGKHHTDTLLRMSKLAAIYENQGRLKEASILRESVRDSSKL